MLESLHDYLPSPPHVQMKAPSGPVASKYVPCEPCAEKGKIVYRGRERLCFSCNGSGTRRRRVSDPEWCAYTRLPVAEARELPTVTHQRVSTLTDQEREQSFAWERKQAAYQRHGSYQELGRALERLRVESPSCWYALTRHYVWGIQVDVEAERRGLVWLAGAMRSVRTPRWVADNKPASARQLALELASQGHGAGTISKRLAVPKTSVKRWLKDRRRVESA